MAPCVQELDFPRLDIPITIDKIERILSDCHNRKSLYLSNLDDMIGVRVFTPTIYFYRSKSLISHDEPVVQTLRTALKEILVPYYPFSGRLRETEKGKLEVFFGPDQGALLVEAHSSVSLADLGDLSVPNPAWIKLIYRFANEEEYGVVNMPPVIAQVTRFECGGFSLGLRMCHCLCDGFGAMQFLTAWARTAKFGSLVLNPKPCWDREVFLPRNTPKIEFPHTEFKNTDEGGLISTLRERLWQGGKLVQKCYKISREYQARLKKLAQSGDGELTCTTFDAMAAHVWRSWVKAVLDDVKSTDDSELFRLTFSVNVRAKLKNRALKDGFYGNALCVACATSTVGRLADDACKLADVARMVHDARIYVSEEYLRSTIDYIELHRPKKLEFGGKLTITQWTRFPIYEAADFGWGEPVYAGPIDLTPTPQVCLFLPESDASGAMIICICLPEFACRLFGELLMCHERKTFSQNKSI